MSQLGANEDRAQAVEFGKFFYLNELYNYHAAKGHHHIFNEVLKLLKLDLSEEDKTTEPMAGPTEMVL